MKDAPRMRSRFCFLSILCCSLFALAAHADIAGSSSSSEAYASYGDGSQTNSNGSDTIKGLSRSSENYKWYDEGIQRDNKGAGTLSDNPFADRRDGPIRPQQDSGSLENLPFRDRRDSRSQHHGASSSDLFRELGIDGICRGAQKPSCRQGREPKKINTGFCYRYVCPGDTIEGCPAVSKPICKDGTKLVTSVDSKGCASATCQAVSVTCAQILCKEGTSPVNTGKTNSAGCPIMACKDSKTCPTYQRPLCKSTDTLTTELDANGCKKPVCQSSCPDYQKPICKDGKLVTEKDKYGCERPTCSQTSTSCAQVLCKEGTTRVATGTNSAGCPTYTCKETQTSTSCAQVLCKEGYSRVYVGQNKGGCPVYKCAPAGATSLVR